MTTNGVINGMSKVAADKMQYDKLHDRDQDNYP